MYISRARLVFALSDARDIAEKTREMIPFTVLKFSATLLEEKYASSVNDSLSLSLSPPLPLSFFLCLRSHVYFGKRYVKYVM